MIARTQIYSKWWCFTLWNLMVGMVRTWRGSLNRRIQEKKVIYPQTLIYHSGKGIKKKTAKQKAAKHQTQGEFHVSSRGFHGPGNTHSTLQEDWKCHGYRKAYIGVHPVSFQEESTLGRVAYFYITMCLCGVFCYTLSTMANGDRVFLQCQFCRGNQAPCNSRKKSQSLRFPSMVDQHE